MGRMHDKHLSHLLSNFCDEVFFVENFKLED